MNLLRWVFESRPRILDKFLAARDNFLCILLFWPSIGATSNYIPKIPKEGARFKAWPDVLEFGWRAPEASASKRSTLQWQYRWSESSLGSLGVTGGAEGSACWLFRCLRLLEKNRYVLRNSWVWKLGATGLSRWVVNGRWKRQKKGNQRKKEKPTTRIYIKSTNDTKVFCFRSHSPPRQNKQKQTKETQLTSLLLSVMTTKDDDFAPDGPRPKPMCPGRACYRPLRAGPWSLEHPGRGGAPWGRGESWGVWRESKKEPFICLIFQCIWVVYLNLIGGFVCFLWVFSEGCGVQSHCNLQSISIIRCLEHFCTTE